MKSVLKSAILKMLNAAMSTALGRSIINYFFIRSNVFRSFVVRNVSIPQTPFIWYDRLLNGKFMKYEVNPQIWQTWQFSHNYTWHNIGLAKAERILHDFYPLSALYIDVGANLGLRSMYAAAIGRPTILVEPNVNLHAFTKNFFKINNFQHYKIEPVCFSDINSNTKFYISSSSYMSSLKAENAADDSSGGITQELDVQVLTLDSYLANNSQLSSPKIIKIDAEGFDLEVLKGATQTLQHHRPSIIVEVNTSDAQSQVRSFMQSLGYSCYFGITDSVNAWLISPEKSPQLIGDCHDFLFCHDPELIKQLNDSAV